MCALRYNHFYSEKEMLIYNFFTGIISCNTSKRLADCTKTKLHFMSVCFFMSFFVDKSHKSSNGVKNPAVKHYYVNFAWSARDITCNM